MICGLLASRSRRDTGGHPAFTASSSGPEGYAGLLQSVIGEQHLLVHWAFSDPGTTAPDLSGNNRHGTWSGAPALVVGLAPDGGLASDTGGAVALVAPHDVGLAVPSFTVSFWVKVKQIPGVSRVLFAKDESGPYPGDFAILLRDDGHVWARFQSAEGSLVGVSAPVQAGATHHLAVTAGPFGLALWVDGRLRGIDESYSGGWSSNATRIDVAGAQFSTLLADVVVHQVAIADRVLTAGEIALVAAAASPPIARPEVGISVPSGGVVVVDVLANDDFVGAAESVAIAVTTQGAHGIAVPSNGAIQYTAGLVESDQPDQIAYTITDSNGTSPPATVSVTVLADAGGGVDAALLPYDETGPDMVEVTTMAALAAAVNAAPPGRIIRVAPGSYIGGTQTFDASGTADSPVVIIPRDGLGTVTVTGANWSLRGSRLVIAKLYFSDSQITLDGAVSRTRITRCRFREINGRTIRLLACSDTRIDRCDASGYGDSATKKSFIFFGHANIGNGTLKRVRLDYLYVHDIKPATAVNGCEPIGQEASTSGALFGNAEAVVDHCLFRNVGPIPGEGEMIGTKSCGWVIQFCTFENTADMYINLPRQGNNCTVRSCWFETGKNPTLIVLSENPVVIGNRFVGQDLSVAAGTTTWQKVIANGKPEALWYSAAWDALIVGNVVDSDRQIIVGDQIGSLTMTDRALRARLEANRRANGSPVANGNGVRLDFETGTTISPTTIYAYTPAVKLTPTQVGLNAPPDLA